MKTILYVFHCSTIGGGSYCLLNILKTVDRSLYKPIVLLANDGPLVEEIKKLSIDVFFYPEMDSVPYNLSLMKRGTVAKYHKINKSLSGFATLVKKINPDVVYLNSMMLYPYLKPVKKEGYKTIIHIREHWSHHEHCIQLSRAQKYIEKYADHVVAINEFAAKQVPHIEHKTTIVYDWIDFSDRYKAIPLEEVFKEDLTNKKVFLFTGGQASNKGAKEVAELFSTYLTDENFRLLVLGNSVREYGHSWKEQFKIWLSDKGIREFYSYELNKIIEKDKRIVCIPNVYEIKHLLEQCFCLVSYFTIPHANLALAESIINHTVVVAAETEESMEYSLGGKLAFLFRMNSQQGFIDAVHKALEQYGMMKERLVGGSSVVSEMFDKNANANKLGVVYHSVLHKDCDK
ncbi:hypothetical protein [Bacteroides congonensis]